MSVPTMPARLDTREEAVEAVLEQVRHAQSAARRVEADQVARRCAEDIVNGLDVVRPDAPAPAVAAVPDLDPAYTAPGADTLSARIDEFLERLRVRLADVLDSGLDKITRGRALDALEAPSAYRAAKVIDPDLALCSSGDQTAVRSAVGAARADLGVVDPPEVGYYARCVEHLAALPVDSVVRDGHGRLCERDADAWTCRGTRVVPILPARVLEVGGEQ